MKFKMEVRVCSDGQNRAVARPYTNAELIELLRDNSVVAHRGYVTLCWEWRRKLTGRGYGIIRHNKKEYTAHRLAWMVNFGNIPDGLFVLHHCDNPSCVRPDHLFLGTHQDNVDDEVAKGRNVKGEQCHAAVLTAQDIPIVRRRARTEFHRVIASDYGISRTAIDKVVNRTNWKHVP